jgi:hemolysin activation/secretion protein
MRLVAQGYRCRIVFFGVCLWTMLWLVALAGTASAQALPAVPPLIAPPTERLQPSPQPRPLPPLEQPGAPVEPIPEGGPTVTLADIEVNGNTVYPTAELAPLYANLIGRPVTQGEAEEAIRTIQAKYRKDGYFLTVTRGALEASARGPVLRIHIVEGFISDVKIEGDIGPAGVLAYRYLNHVTENRPVNISEVERALLLVQGIPGVSARAVLRPGAAEVGAVELVAQLGRKAFGGIVDYDNRGSDFAGKGELLASAYANSFTSLGDETQLTIFDTPWNDEQVFGQLSESILVGSDGLKLGAYYGIGLSEPGSFLAATGYKGHLAVGGFQANYPLIRTRPLSLIANFNFDLLRSTVDTFGANNVRTRQSTTNLRVLRGGGTVDFQDDTLGLGMVGANTVNFTTHKGIVGMGSSRNSSPLPARNNNVIDFLKFTAEATRVQNLFDLDEWLFALKLSSVYQYTDDILPPSEEYFLGGARYGRGYFSGEVVGDRVWANTIELQISTVTEGLLNIGLQYYAFYDHGTAWSLEPGDPIRHVRSAGVGVRVDVTPQVTGEFEAVRRFNRQPTGSNTVPEAPQAFFVHLIGRF